MEQELIEKKKEIVKFFLDKDILISTETLEKINEQNIDQVYEKFKTTNTTVIKDITELSKEEVKPENTEERTEQETQNEEKKKLLEQNKVNIVYSLNKESNKIEIQDFVKHFKVKYDVIEKILRQRQELQNITSISRIKNKKERESTAIIGCILDKKTTKNGHIMVELEDTTGSVRVLLNKNKPELLRLAEDLTLDEVVGITGVTGQDIIFATNLYQPETITKELKKSPDEVCALFISDLHIGSRHFLHKEFKKLTEWIQGKTGNPEQKETMQKIKYIFIVGDLVDGVGIYPGQEKDLDEIDIEQQFKIFEEFIQKIPDEIQIIICPGNHEPVRLAEPQPHIPPKLIKNIKDKPNFHSVSNPAIINIHSSQQFEGFDVLLYHGSSFPYYADIINSIRKEGGQTRPDLIMKYLIQRRHLAPTHTSTQYHPDPHEDALIIEKTPDIFATGHIHRVSASNYKNITLLNCSSWIGMTEFQEKVGLIPEPARALIVNLQTRKIKIMKF